MRGDGWDDERFSGEPSPGTRRWRENERSNARIFDLLMRRFPPGQKHTIEVDQEAWGFQRAVLGAPSLVLFRCRGCGSHLGELRTLNGQLVSYRDYRVIEDDDDTPIVTTCSRCQQVATAPMRRLRTLAADALIDGKPRIIRVGRRSTG